LIGDKASLAVAEAIGKVKAVLMLSGRSMIIENPWQDNYAIARSPINDMKSVKNTTELEGFRQCHIRDGSALARYFAWLEEQLNNGVELNESQGADQLEKFRSWVFISHLQFPYLNISSQGARFIQRTFV
jgi:Xaa-Pro aminopeptidase